MLEPLTPEQATTVLRRHVGAGVTCTAVQRGPIGNGQETWFLDVDGGPADQLVVRRTAEAGPLEWTDRVAEADAMDRVADLLPVPRIHAVSADGEGLGAPWMLMDLAPGRSAMALRGDQRRAVAADLGHHLGRLHTAALADPLGRSATQATRDEVARWRDHYHDHRVAPVPIIDALLAWCATTVPQVDEAAVLVWGDAGAHNALAADGIVTAMLDWELAHHGHPLEDLASAAWIDGDVGHDGLVAAWEETTGTPVDRAVLDWFLAMVCLTRSIMITVGAGAFVRGRTAAPHLAGLGLDLPAVNLARAAALAGWGDPPALDEHLAPPLVDGLPASAEVLRPSGPEIDTGIARFLRDDVLPRMEDPRTRRGLKTAAALLDTAALRARAESAVTAVRRERTAALLDELGLGTDLATVAARIEREPDLAPHRSRMRAHLLADLAAQHRLLGPLTDLYHP